jgi:hypothetical protein
MTEFGENSIEHDAAERIVLDAQHAQRRNRIMQCLAIRLSTGGRRGLGAAHADRQRKAGSSATPRPNDDIAAHRARQRLHRRQSEPRAAEARRDRDIGLRERPEQPPDLLELEADPAVGNLETDADLALDAAHRRHRQRDAARFGELHRIVDQVFQGGAQADGIADHERRKLFRNIDRRLQAFGRGPAGQGVSDAACHRPQIEQLLPHAGMAAPRRIDEQGREARKMFGAGPDGIDPTALALVEIGGREQIADGENSGQRRADFVRERGERRVDDAADIGRGALAARLARGNLASAFFRWPFFGRPCRAP